MRRAGAVVGAVVGAVASVALLAACVSPVATPAPPTDEEALAFAQDMLDGTFTSLDIEGGRLTSSTELQGYDTWNSAITTCLNASGVEGASVGWTDAAYQLYTYDGLESDPGENQALYNCVSFNPLDMRSAGALHTEAERVYAWDYYQRWLMPCLAARQITLVSVPSRDDFMAEEMYLWTPYQSIDYEQVMARLSFLDGADPYTALSEVCGPPFGVIEQ